MDNQYLNNNQGQQGYNRGYNQAESNGVMPSNNLVWAILCTVLCCLPLGIYAIMQATKVEGLWARGDYQGAIDAANAAKKWSIIGAVAGLVVSVIYIIFMVVVSVASSSSSGYYY